MLDLETLRKIYTGTSEAILGKYVEPLNITMEKYEINTPRRAAMFLAQIGHESGNLKTTMENLRYSAKRLRQVWPRRFNSDALALRYANNPEALANFTYGGRMGNGPENSGDGWKYRGRGFIQLTGKNNYVNFAESLNIPVDEAVEYLETPDGCAHSAGWFWWRNELNPIADRGDVRTVTRRINGGEHGLDERAALYRHALRILES